MTQTRFAVLEFPESEEADLWRTTFASIPEALAAIEEHHQQLWLDCDMDGEAPELNVVASEERATAGAPVEVEWPRWRVASIEI